MIALSLRLLAASALVGSLFLACSSSSSPNDSSRDCDLSASNFDDGCNSDGDCTAVYEGTICGDFCACPNAAIASTDATKYATYLSANGGGAQCKCPALGSAMCVQQRCEFVGGASVDAGTD